MRFFIAVVAVAVAVLQILAGARPRAGVRAGRHYSKLRT